MEKSHTNNAPIQPEIAKDNNNKYTDTEDIQKRKKK